MGRGKKTGAGGFTLVELLLALVIAALVVLAIPAAFRGGTQVWQRTDRHAEVLQNGMIGLEEVVRELRQADELMAISAPDDDEGYIQFRYRDLIDEDSDGGTQFKYQRYELASAGDYMTHTKHYDSSDTGWGFPSASEVAGPVSSLRFTGYKSDSTTTSNVDDIWFVQIELITEDSEDRINDIPLSARVYLERDLPSGRMEDFAIFGDDGVELRPNTNVGNIIDPSNIGSNGCIDLDNEMEINGEIVYLDCVNNIDRIDPGSNYTLRDEFTEIEMPCPTDFGPFLAVEPKQGLDTSTQNGTIIPDDIWGTVPGDYVVMGSDGITPCLKPGVYGDFDLGADHVLRLTSGTYFFMSFQTKKGLNLELDLGGSGNTECCSDTDPDESGHTTVSDVWIFVEGQAVIGNMLEGSVVAFPEGIGIPDAAAYVYAECHYQDDPTDSNDYGWIMGQNTFWYGTIYVPFASLAITDGDIYGALYSGGQVEIHGGAVSPGPGLPNYDTQINYVKSNYAWCYWTYPSDYWPPTCPAMAGP
jgi:hypothetical protein